MAKVTVRVEGLQQLGENLKTFSREVQTRVMRAAVRKAANEVRDAARNIVIAKGLIGDEPLHVRDAIGSRRMPKASRNGKEFMAVGTFKIRGKKGATAKAAPPEFYWKFLEFGTVKMSAKPFLVPAFESKKASLPQTMKTELAKGMERATRRLAKPRGRRGA